MINKKAIVLSQEEEDYFLELGRKAAEEEKIEEAEKKGENVGFEKGESEKSKEIAKKLLKDGLSIDKVSEYTGLSKEEIEKTN